MYSTLGLTNNLIDGRQPRAKNVFLRCDLASLYVDDKDYV